MVVVGAVIVAFAALYFALKVYLSFTTEGGTIGQVPVLDGAVLPPFFALIGLSMVEQTSGWPGLPGWCYCLGGVVGTVAGSFIIVRAGRWGRRYHCH